MEDEKVLDRGDKAPDFCLPDQREKEVCLNSFRGKWVVLYFYPKDNTKGCTTEAIGFSENLEGFSKLNTLILGVSPDSSESHIKFTDKHDLKITLLSDLGHKVLERYRVWRLKKTIW